MISRPKETELPLFPKAQQTEPNGAALAQMSRERRGVFGGKTFDEAQDGPRLSRQLDRVREFMRDGQWHTLREIASAAMCSEASASARFRDLSKPGFGGWHTEHRRSAVPSIWEYRVVSTGSDAA